MKITSFINHKGGVGKTTLSYNYTHHLAKKKKVLFLDLDPQMAASFLFDNFDDEAYVGRVFEGQNVVPAEVAKNIFLINSGKNLKLVNAGDEFRNKLHQQLSFKKYLDSVKNSYDYCIIDTPPTINVLLQHVIMLSDFCVIPLQTEILPVLGLESINTLIHEITTASGAARRYFITVNMFARGTTIQNKILAELRARYPHEVLDTQIRRSIAVVEAQNNRVPISALNKPVAEDFRLMFKELENKCN